MLFNGGHIGLTFQLAKPHICTPHVVLYDGMVGTCLAVDPEDETLQIEFPMPNGNVKAWIPENGILLMANQKPINTP